MSLTLTQLQTFVRVAAVGNFTRVAEQLHLTQPAVTQHVHALERHFGVRLVDVIGRRPVLTEAGQFLASRAGELLEGVAAVEREMGEFAAARSGELHLGATLTIGSYVLPALLARFRASHPGIQVQVEIANTALTAERVRGNALGLAMVEGPLDDPLLEAVPFQDDRLLLVVPPAHRFADQAWVPVGALHGEPFIWREYGSGTRALAEAVLTQAGVRPRGVLALPSGEGVARAVETGLGVTIISELVVERAIAEGRLVAVEIGGVDLRRTFRLVTLRGRTLSPAARALIDLTRTD